MRRVTALGAILGLVMVGLVVLPASPASATTTVRTEWELGGCNGTGSGWQSAVGGSGGANCQNSAGWTTKTIKTFALGASATIAVHGWKWPSGSPNGRYKVDGGTTVNWSAYQADTADTAASLFTFDVGPGEHTLEVWSETVHYMVLDYFEYEEVDPQYCDIDVLGEASDVAKDPAQTYRYEITITPRGDHPDARPDFILFTASWQENNPQAAVLNYDVDQVDPPLEDDPPPAYDMMAGQPGPYGAYIDVEPTTTRVVIEVEFAEAKSYAHNFACVSLEGHVTNWVAGDYLPDPESEAIADDLVYQRLQECVPSGWGVLNPVAFVRGLGCVLIFLFKPNASVITEPVQEAVEGGVLDAAGSIQGTLSDAWGAMADSASEHAGDCQGPVFSIPSSEGPSREVALLSTCSAPASTFAPVVRGFILFGLGFIVLSAFLRGIGRLVGHDGGV